MNNLASRMIDKIAQGYRASQVLFAAVLASGGRLAVKDFILRNSRTGPVSASLFAINMLVNTPQGDCYSAKEIRDWMRCAGLVPAGTVRLRSPSRVVLGRKP